MAAAGGSLVAVKSVPVAFQGKPRKSADLKRTENAEKQRGSPRKGDCGCDILLGACRARSVSPVAVPATPAAPASLPPPPSPQERHGLHSDRPRSLTSMEEDVILKQLSSGTQTAGKRVEAIKATRGYIYSNPGKLLFKKRNELLTAVVEVLEKDARRDVKAQCVQLVCDIVQIPDPELDRFRQAVLPGLLFDLKDESPSMRKELVQTLHKCLKYSRSPEKILSALVEHGLESREASVRTATVVLLPILLPKDFHSVDLYDIIESLTKKLTNISGSSGPNDPVVAFSTLDYIRQHLAVGQDEFNAYLKRLPPGLRRDYNRFIDDNFEQLSVDSELNNNNTPRSAYPRGRCPSPSPAAAVSGGSPSLNDSPLILSPLKEHSGMKYGIVPLDLHSRLLDLKDYKARTHAVEELKSVISHTDLSNVPPANVLGLIGFLCSLLDDSNFKVTHSTLEILNLLVVKLGRHVEQFLRAVVTTAVKVLGDNKAVTKQAYMKVYMGLMKNAGPQKLLDLLLENVKHRNSKVREEVINIIIASLLTHPSEDFDLPKLCFAVAPALADGKRKVRHAALEVFAVLASSMGSGKMQSLVKAVDQVELHEDVDGLMAAVQARLARRTLPKLTAHGLVEYAVPIAASAHGRASQQVPQGADTEWLFGGGRTSSATSNRGDTERGPHQGHRSTSPQGEETPIHRRVLSASKGKNKLPWENTNTPTKTPFQPAKAPNDTDTITKEQVSQIYGEVPQSPKLRRSPTMPANDDLFITRKSAVKSAKQGNVQAMNLVNSSTLTNTGAAEWHQPRISGKQGLLGYSRSSGSVDSDLQFLGTSSQLEKAPLHASLNLSTKTQRGLYSHPSVERTLSGPSTAGGGSSSSSSIASQGAFILPSYPLSSPGSGQLHTTPPRKGMEDSVGFSNTWPSKPLDGTSNSSPRKRLPSSRTDDTQVEVTQKKNSQVSVPTIVRPPPYRCGFSKSKPVPPIPRGPRPSSHCDAAARDHKQQSGVEVAQKTRSQVSLIPTLVRTQASRRGFSTSKTVPPIPRGPSLSGLADGGAQDHKKESRVEVTQKTRSQVSLIPTLVRTQASRRGFSTSKTVPPIPRGPSLSGLADGGTQDHKKESRVEVAQKTRSQVSLIPTLVRTQASRRGFSTSKTVPPIPRGPSLSGLADGGAQDHKKESRVEVTQKTRSQVSLIPTLVRTQASRRGFSTSKTVPPIPRGPSLSGLADGGTQDHKKESRVEVAQKTRSQVSLIPTLVRTQASRRGFSTSKTVPPIPRGPSLSGLADGGAQDHKKESRVEVTQKTRSQVSLIPTLVRTQASRRGFSTSKTVPPIPRGPSLSGLADGGTQDHKKESRVEVTQKTRSQVSLIPTLVRTQASRRGFSTSKTVPPIPRGPSLSGLADGGTQDHKKESRVDMTQEKHSPVPLKPALVRTPSSRRGINGTKPVPPIPRGACLPSLADGGGRDPKKAGGTQESGGEKSLALDLSELDVKDDEPDHEEDRPIARIIKIRQPDYEEMMSSLRSLRYSAAKKRAKLSGSPPEAESPDSALKLELTLDFSSLASSTFTSPISESGIYSPPEAPSSPLTPTPPTNTKTNTLRNHRTMSESFNPFASRPRLAATPDLMKSTRPVEYSPPQGVSFHDRATSDVSVVGQRMGYANGAVELEEGRQGEPSTTTAKMHRGAKPTKGSPASLGNTQQQNNHDVTSANGMHEDSVVIVGKGVFGSPMASLTYSQTMLCSAENGDGAGKHSTETPPAIYGKSVQQNSHSTFESSDQAEREVTVAISKSARDKMRRRKNKAEREQLLREQERKERLEESLRERLRAIDIDSSPDDLIVNGGVLLKSKAESLSAESTPLSPPPLKCTPSLRKARSPSSDEVSAGPRTQRKQRASSIPRASETVEPSDVRPFSKPEQALLDALRLMADDDWEKKIEGIGFVRSLSIYHPDVLTTRLHDIALAMIREVKNLRSGVSRVAVMCLGDMFTHLKVMEQELDGTVRALLHKAGESNTFIREDVDKALGAMVSNVTPARALCALIAGGSSHLNSVVRKCTALHLSGLVERMGPGRLLSGIRDVTDRLLPVVAKFTQDSSPETRYYGRRMIYLMMSHQDFDKVLEKYLTPKDLPYIKDTVHNLRLKGLGEIPQDAPSARGRRSLPGSGTTRASSNTRDPHSSIAREPGESTWKPAVRNLVDNHEFIKQLTGTLNSKDFRERIKGIHQLVSECETNQDLIVSNMFPIFDAFKTRLHDSNSKVCLMALESLQKIILLLGNHLSQVVYILVPAIVDTNLNSKNSAVYTAAINALHCLSEQLDNSVLLQPFCTKAQYLTGKAKQDMTEKVADLVTELYPRKPQLVEQRVLPLLWHLLSSVSSGSTLPGKGSSMRGSTAKLCKALSEHMGDSNLLSLAASKSPQTSKNVLELLAITT